MSNNRNKIIADIKEQEFDLLVIGGGITGTGIALDAQDRGLNTALIEMQDFAAGTSSRSTKLVHGGLRYLKQLEFHIVAETGQERAIVYENAPHVTTPEWMLLPIIKGGTFGMFSSSIGLYMYDFLAKVKKSEKRKMLNKDETLKRVPLLREDILKGSGYYVEYKTDDARLTLEVIKKAIEKGTKAINYTKAEDFIYENGKVIGVNVKDILTGEEFKIKAKKIVNAAGPWVDTLREKDGSKKGKYLYLTKGVHIVVSKDKFPLEQAVYFDNDDGRMLFAVPRENKVYIGTTDTHYKDDLISPKATKEDRDYILDATNKIFPKANLQKKDVESFWAGVRPLIHEEGKSASEISRKDEIFYSDTGLITIAGGKLTGYRKMAEKIVDIVSKDLDKYKPCRTDTIALSGGNFGGSDKFKVFVESKIKEGEKLGLTTVESSRLVRRYGTNVDKVFEIIKNDFETANKYNLSLEVYGALKYSLNEELVCKPIDFFLRRTSSLLFDIEWTRKWKDPVISFMSDYFNWENKDLYIEDLEKYLSEIEEFQE